MKTRYQVALRRVLHRTQFSLYENYSTDTFCAPIAYDLYYPERNISEQAKMLAKDECLRRNNSIEMSIKINGSNIIRAQYAPINMMIYKERFGINKVHRVSLSTESKHYTVNAYSCFSFIYISIC